MTTTSLLLPTRVLADWHTIPAHLNETACPPPRPAAGAALRALKVLFSEATSDETSTWDNDVKGQVATSIITYTTRWLDALPADETPTLLQDLVLAIHEQLFALHVYAEAQTAAAALCEKYWISKRPQHALVVAQLVPTVLVRTFEVNESPTRIYNLRDALRLLDLEDDSASILKELLVRCFTAPSYWDVANGRKFLAVLLTLSQHVTLDGHAAIKAQLPALSKTRSPASKAVIGYIGEVYHTAWKMLSRGAAEEEQEEQDPTSNTAHAQLQHFEKHIVQDLMRMAVSLQDNTMIKTVWKILNTAFHVHKSERGMDAMLTHMYKPILWRGLESPNAQIRKNAISVFVHAFPLQDPSLGIEDTSDFFDKQFNMVQTFLKDTSPDVRVAAIEGACKILSVYWEMMPPKVTSKWLQIMVNDLAFDASSAPVRAAVLHGVNYMLDEPLTHSAVKMACQHLKTLIRDKSPTVRLAMIKLLHKIDNVRGMRYRDVVPVQHVLERLERDANDTKLCIGMVELFLHSFYPQEADGAEQLRRAKRLAIMQPKAAKVFFQNLFRVVPVNKVCKLAMLFASFCRGVRLEQVDDATTTTNTKRARRDHQNEEEEEKKDGNEQHPHHEIAELLDSAATLWISIKDQLAQENNAQALHDMEKTFAHDGFISQMETWSELIEAVPTSRHSILRLASLGKYRAAQSKTLEGRIVKHIETWNGQDASCLEGEIGFHLDCLMAWDRDEEMITTAVDVLTGTKRKTTMDNRVAMFILHRAFSLGRVVDSDAIKSIFDKHNTKWTLSVIKDGLLQTSSSSSHGPGVVSTREKSLCMFMLRLKLALISAPAVVGDHDDNGTTNNEISSELDQLVDMCTTLYVNPAKRNKANHTTTDNDMDEMTKMVLVATLHILGDAATLGHRVLCSAVVRNFICLPYQDETWNKARDRFLHRCRSKLDTREEDAFFSVLNRLFEQSAGVAMVASLLGCRSHAIVDRVYEIVVVPLASSQNKDGLRPLIMTEAYAKALAHAATRAMENKQFMLESVFVLVLVACNTKVRLLTAAKQLRAWVIGQNDGNTDRGDLKLAKQASDAAGMLSREDE